MYMKTPPFLVAFWYSVYIGCLTVVSNSREVLYAEKGIDCTPARYAGTS